MSDDAFVQGSGPLAQQPPTLAALDGARAACAGRAFASAELTTLALALRNIRRELATERGYPRMLRTTWAGALQRAREALALVEAEPLSAETRARIAPSVASAWAEVERLTGHAAVLLPSSAAEQC